MTRLIITSCLALVLLVVCSCQSLEEKTIHKTEKDFGRFVSETNHTAVELKLTAFKDWNNLYKRTEQIACHDSIPKITIENDSMIKRVYFGNPCWEDYACILIKQRNIIEIHNDTINKLDKYFYPLDSLTSVIRRDLANYGKNPNWSDKPEKLLISISYDKDGIKQLPNTLEQLTQAIERVTDRKDISIWLNEKLFIPPPPPITQEKIERIEAKQ